MIEAEGVRRALARAEEADLRIWVSDAASVSRETRPAPRAFGVLAGGAARRHQGVQQGGSPGIGAPEAGAEDVFAVRPCRGPDLMRSSAA